MKQTHKIAYNYAMALKHQRESEELVGKAFATLGSDNQLFSLCEPLEHAYNDLVLQSIGEDLFDWLLWWMYETDYGTKSMEFSLDYGKTQHDPTTMTLFRFLEIVDASN